MPRMKLPYKEGDWIAVPLRKGGYAVGLVARVPPGGRVLLGYFFGPKLSNVPSMAHTNCLKHEDAIFVTMFGDLALMRGDWPIIGRCESWDRDEWPMPLFTRIDSISGKVSLIEYSDEDNDEIGEMPGKSGDIGRYPEDGMWGYGAVEIRLTTLLAEESNLK